MYTEPKISNAENVGQRCFIYFQYNNKRYKFYNGKRLNLPLNPNRCQDLTERKKHLLKLAFEFEKALVNGWNPLEPPIINRDLVKKEKGVYEALSEGLRSKLNSPLSDTYKRDLQGIYDHFIRHLTEDERKQPISSIKPNDLESFLTQFNTSGTNYMNKRRALGVLFSVVVAKGFLKSNPVLKCAKQKAKATLHKIYTDKQLKQVLGFLKSEYPNLYLCCLLGYGCLIRPHQEFRLLQRKHFNEDLTEIHLSGFENKSGRIRIVYVPEYVQAELRRIGVENILPSQNITSGGVHPFSVGYFSLQWARAKRKMLKLGYLQKEHTIYSFRHTAAVNVYKQTKDLHLLQQLLGHSNMIVTLKYLRGLGVHSASELRQVMPKL